MIGECGSFAANRLSYNAECDEWFADGFDPEIVDLKSLTDKVDALAKRWSRKSTAPRARRTGPAALTEGLQMVQFDALCSGVKSLTPYSIMYAKRGTSAQDAMT